MSPLKLNSDYKVIHYFLVSDQYDRITVAKLVIIT